MLQYPIQTLPRPAAITTYAAQKVGRPPSREKGNRPLEEIRHQLTELCKHM